MHDLRQAWDELMAVASTSAGTAVAFLAIATIFMLGLWKAVELFARVALTNL